MKEGIHPTVREVVFQDTVTGAQYIVTSAVKTEAKVKIDGKEYKILSSDDILAVIK